MILVEKILNKLSEIEIIRIIFSDISFFTIFLMAIAIFLVVMLIYIFIRNRELEKKVYKKTIAKEKELEKETKINELSDIILKMQSELGENEEKPVYFEDEQEEEAIISYQELKKQASKNQEQAEQEIVEYEKAEEEAAVATIDEAKELAKPKFRNSEIISPVFGRIRVREEYQSKIEEDVEDIFPDEMSNDDKVIGKGEEFLKSLKDFRRNLK